MRLNKLLEGIEILETKNAQDMDVKCVEYHSKRVQRGYLYVAIKGYKTDGHLYISEAVDKGAVAAVVEEFSDIPIPQIKVANTRVALSRLGANLYGHPSKSIRTIGVTATNGKTTTTFILDRIFELAGFKSGVIGSVLNKTGGRIETAELTTPESLDLQGLFSEMVGNEITRTSMEVSSSALELSRTKDIDFDIVSFANFSREHIDQHGSFERYWEVKSSLIRNAKDSAIAVLNVDDERIASLREQTNAKVVTYSISGDNGDILCRNVRLIKGRGNFQVVIKNDIDLGEVTIKKGDFNVSLGIPGYHSVENAMAATVIALADGIPVKIIIEALSSFKGVERRFEFVYEDDFIIVDDHFANVKNINSTLGTLADMEKNKLHIVYAIRGNRGITVNRENAEALVYWKDKLGINDIVATRSIGAVGWKDEVSPEEEKVLKEVIEQTDLELKVFDTLREAIGDVLKRVEKDDIVLLAGCQGMDRGARVAFDIITEIHPEIDRKRLYSPLVRRVAEHMDQL